MLTNAILFQVREEVFSARRSLWQGDCSGMLFLEKEIYMRVLHYTLLQKVCRCISKVQYENWN
jgi:hypothetical protein